MTEEELNRLLRKYFTGEITAEEDAQLQEWSVKSEENRQLFNSLKRVWHEKSSEPKLINTEALVDHIWQQSTRQTKARKIDWNYISKIAAVFIIFITTPLLVLHITREAAEEPVVSALEKVIKFNPAGQKAKIYLPDGSLVWLNGATSLTYYSNFNETNRDISLVGEAFFEVTQNEALPFQVVCDNITTVAIGTAFNVEAYPEVEQIEVSLVHGQVKVTIDQKVEEDILLNPGSQVNYNLVNNEITKRAFDQNNVIGWKDGNLVFDRATYQEVINKLQKWYGIAITTRGNPPVGWKLSTTYQDESLRNILNNLRFGKNFTYKLSKNELKINFK